VLERGRRMLIGTTAREERKVTGCGAERTVFMMRFHHQEYQSTIFISLVIMTVCPR
jgi:hypothetical protein